MIEKYLNDIIHKLNSVIRRENIKSSLKGLSFIFIGFGLTYLGFALLEMFFNFSGGARTGIFYSVVVIFLLLTIYYVVFPLIKRTPLTLKPDYPETAKKVGKYFPEIKDDLSNALQLLNSKGNGFSQELVEAAFEKVYNKAKDLEFDNAVEFSSLKKYWQTAGGLMSAIILLFIFFPGLKSGAHRLINYNREFIVPAKFVLRDQGSCEARFLFPRTK
jgi:hypothetical protein